MFRIIKAIFFWGYARNTWQYDVLCALILAFIFLTPKGWFKNGELRSAGQHQSMSASSRIIVSSDIILPEMSHKDVEIRLRELTGRPDLTVSEMRPTVDSEGKTLSYEVDIR